MIKEFIFTVAAALNANSGQNIEEKNITIPAGISEVSASIEWNAMTMFSPKGGELPLIWYQKNGTWMPWHNFEENETNQPDSLDLLFAGNSRKNITIKSEATADVIAHFYNTKVKNENLLARFDPFDDDSLDDPRTGLAHPVKGPQYITRREWGADESLRNRTFKRGFKSFFRSSVPEAKQVSKVLRPTIVQRKNDDGSILSWPIEENPKIKKFIIHHTGEYIDEKRDPKELMRAIYYFHTITRGWGDIGYNYVIDKKGNIYEGRYGGPTTVGAHTAFHNVASMGVSLMGNFETEKPTAKQLEVLELTLADHAIRYGVDPSGRSLFLGINSYNISGHRDVAREGHATACPGKNLHALLPDIRKKVAYLKNQINKKDELTTRDFLSKSTSAPKFTRTKVVKEKVPAPASLTKLLNKATILQRGDKTTLDISLKNNTDIAWLKGQKLITENVPEGIRMTSFRATKKIHPKTTGIFRAKIWVETTPNGKYAIDLTPQIEVSEEYEGEMPSFKYPIQISGNKVNLAKTEGGKKYSQLKSIQASLLKNRSTKNTSNSLSRATQTDFGPDVKIKLAFFKENYAILASEDKISISSKGEIVKDVSANQEIKIIPTGKNRSFRVSVGRETWDLIQPQFKANGIIKIKNYDRGLGKIAYNQFRQQLNFYPTTGQNFYIVNQLPIEKYLWGLAEEPKTEPLQKKHAIYILARSYAYVYSGNKRKFKTSFYDLEDDPRSSQFYLGYDWEYYHAEQQKHIAETKGTVITYKGKSAIGPYFTQSAGESSNLWHNQYPWTRAQKLPYDEGLEQKGHGIGLSGNTARILAEKGMKYERILDYFYDGIKIEKKF